VDFADEHQLEEQCLQGLVMETSCGVVLVNIDSILLLQYPQGHWDLPKGHVESNDSNKQATARRELKEETGIDDIVFISGFEHRTAYSFRHKGQLIKKEVWWYLAETETMKIELSHEHQQYLWLDWERAIEQVTHDEARKLLNAARAHVNA
jgi:8-oxo-dGTP pyrophosphatase MutT (NUDIX family)